MTNEANYHIIAVDVETDENHCPSGCECPVCGERDMDRLAIQDDETVICDCGHHYELADCGFGDDN